MYRIMKAMFCGAFLAVGLLGCSAGTTEVVTEEDPESVKKKQEMIQGFLNRQQGNQPVQPQQAPATTPAPEAQ